MHTVGLLGRQTSNSKKCAGVSYRLYKQLGLRAWQLGGPAGAEVSQLAVLPRFFSLWPARMRRDCPKNSAGYHMPWASE